MPISKARAKRKAVEDALVAEVLGNPKPKRRKPAKPNPGWENWKKNFEGKGFKPGQSGNPAGRPKKLISVLSEALREQLAKTSDDGVRSWAEVIAERMVQEAASMKGQVIPAAKEIADRTEGKPKQQIDVNDVTDKFSGRTKEELAFFAANGKFPDDVQR